MYYILGGNGFVGSAYAKLLAELNLPFQVISRGNYQKFVGTSCDVLINANGNSKKFLGNTDPEKEFIESVLSVRKSLIDFKFNKYVYLSTSDIYPDCSNVELTHEDTIPDVTKQSTYGFHKYLAEQCVRHSSKRWLIVRQGGFVGEGLKKNAIYDVLHGEKLWVNPESTFQFINTLDSARCVLELIKSDINNEVVNLTAKGVISIAHVMKLANREIPGGEDAKPVHYEISTKKVEQLVELPTTIETITRFLDVH
ncbi:NAD-dependent epimerase/dehydratase family protein [Permianibacter aggregans]|uniref:dTDP-4-dehydrorhamnose reductase n=1 Tax=Permianibacter aggregans TaxID=1510150 RepID=A0A4R6UUX0_9GAMM|nr:NAD-dependent epimerase/dehydratase family protein [Permianibacter aggregans]QGX41334.1 NAD(P)-dependent oxidoreductase [Permianibacter aggregans]TDQ51120.1 dTDP-4-dehydrorhamnose reductase [Permianibacter aggregans]